MTVYPHKHDAIARVYESEDRLWVTNLDLLDAGYAPEDFLVVYLNGMFFELQGYADTPDAWWMERVNA
ncbi:MAG TPA: hypothetical protein VN039_11025 [Nitrospira sp.]|nr:hypothetical protein [Nitrospira sp.]